MKSDEITAPSWTTLEGMLCSTQQSLELLSSVNRALESGSNADEVCETMIDALLEKLHDLGWEATQQRARSAKQLKVKARILLEFCGSEGDDLMQSLCYSLCRDILAADGLGSNA